MKTGKPVDGDRWRPNSVVVRAAIAFFKGTGKFAAHALVED